MKHVAAFAVLLGVAGGAVPAIADVYRFVGPDGTVHFTNAPTDPRYRREGLTSSTPIVLIARPAVRSPRYEREISEAAERYGIPEPLIRAVIRAESGFNPRAVSRKGARGLMQLMPETAAVLGVRDSFNPRQNIDAGVRHLRGLKERLGDDLRIVLAAYNAGEQAVLTYGGMPPYPETRQYVSRVLDLYGGAATTLPRSTFRTIDRNGTVVYTNLPPQGRPF
ncbi:MAG: transglycosylase SLT domain-containing protein [Candidatus Rokuibacteriota bacterium]